MTKEACQANIMQAIYATSQEKLKVEIKKYVWVDALRGYAILLVMMAHSGQAIFGVGPPTGIINSGIHGVSLFFIASSFTLFNSYKNRLALDGENKNLFFFIRRVFRIAPLYWLACLLYILLGHLYQSIWLPATPFSFVNIMANVLFLNGVYLPAIIYIPPGSWSIGDEMIFYLAIPFLFLMIKNLRAATFVLTAAIVGSFLLQILLHYVITNHTSYSWVQHREWALFLWFPNQFPVFCFGIVLFFFLGNHKLKYKEWMLGATVICYLLLSFLPYNLNFPYFLIQSEYLYAAVFFAFAFCMSKTKFRFVTVPVNELGKVSFSVYLIHFLVIDFGLWLSGLVFDAGLNKELNYFLLFLFTVFVTYFFSKWTYLHIEKKGMSLGERLIERIKKSHV